MSVGDSGARPKDYKLQPPKDRGASLNELEKQEKTLKKELKKLTPKKVTHNIDTDLLKAERDELKRQVILKRKSSQKDKVCREIQELRERLSSLDKATSAPDTEGASSGVTIRDLRKMDSPNHAVDSKYSPDILMMMTMMMTSQQKL